MEYSEPIVTFTLKEYEELRSYKERIDTFDATRYERAFTRFVARNNLIPSDEFLREVLAEEGLDFEVNEKHPHRHATIRLIDKQKS